MWSARSEPITKSILKIVIDLDSAPVSFADVLGRWQDDAGFRAFFLALLAAAPFAAFRWETPPVSAASAQRPFEFVLLDSPGLAGRPDLAAFANHFGETSSVVSFPNLGKDAILVVPCPQGPPSAYSHLAAFVREAPEQQKHALWQLIGKTLQEQLGPAPIWLSTAGAGVSWLHVRIDKRPKYYGFAAYRDSSSR